MATVSPSRGQWSSKLAFVLAAAGSAVGLGNIWKFPSEVAQHGGAAFLVIYLGCCFLVGFPVMVAEIAIGRSTGKNPVGAFKALSPNPLFPLVGLWGILCGVMILSFYTVVAGWTLGYVFGEAAHFTGLEGVADVLMVAGPGTKTAVFAALFMLATTVIVSSGVSDGIERVTKTLMPLLIGLLVVMIIYVLTREGSSEGLAMYLKPDFSRLNTSLVFKAMGQAFFSLSLGMGALITYGSYMGRKQNVVEAAAWVTLADVGIAFLAGLLIMPAMFVAQKSGIQIYQDAPMVDGVAAGAKVLINEDGLVFTVLPQLFDSMGTGVGLIFGVGFFLLLTMAALTSTISLLEVPTSYAIDELGFSRKKAAMVFGGVITVIAVVISYRLSLIGTFGMIFSSIGLPVGGLMICLFLAYVWKTRHALAEMEDGFEGIQKSLFAKVWPTLMAFVCPVLILLVLVTTLVQQFS
jgi:NSS family neurotransmitter:Na+ symporter